MSKLTFNHYKNSDDLCKWIAERSGGVCLLSFSGGKEAVGCWIKLKQYFHTIYPVYYYMVPDLGFVNRTLDYYEQFFGQKIIRVPNPNLIRMLNNGVYQTVKSYDIIDTFQYEMVTYDEIFTWVKEDLGLPETAWTAIGVRAADNLNRYGSIKKYGAHNENRNTFYPLYDYKIGDLVDLLRSAKVKMPVDYRIWGKSFDGMDYRFIRGIREHFPEDFEKIRNFFPLIEAEILRYEQV